jgi:drug/metabolite transporter (DMT)-like permease
MPYLLLVSLIWGLSFGLIKVSFAGVDGNLLGLLRLLLALPLFLPLLRLRGLPARTALLLAAIGAIQYGLMYACLFAAYASLAGHEIALLTVLTPFYVALCDAFWHRRWHGRWLLAALLACGGGAVLFLRDTLPGAWQGIALMQLSNFSFAVGQIAYRELRPQFAVRGDAAVFALLYGGALLPLAVLTALSDGWRDLALLDGRQWLALAYLGSVASGLCFFWWNRGAAMVPAGVLAVLNNLKIPLAVILAAGVFGEQVSLPNLLLGTAAVAAAWWLAAGREKTGKPPSAGGSA